MNGGRMRSFVGVLVFSMSSVAIAQPGAPVPEPLAPQPQPAYAQPAPTYVQPPPPPPPTRSGLTFEANLGIGWIHASADAMSDTSDLGVGGLCLGLGGWVGSRTAISARISGVTVSQNDSRLTHAFFGPSVQYWVDDHVWLGGGVGLSVLAASTGGSSDSVNGIGFDLRAGYTFTTGSENTLNISFELNPGQYDQNGASATFTGIAILLGYQHL